MSNILSSHATLRWFHLDSGVFEFDVDHRFHNLVVAALEIEKNEEVRLVAAERDDLLTFLAAYRGNGNANQRADFMGAAFRNLDADVHVVAIAISKIGVEFLTENVELLMSGKLLTHFSVFLGPWSGHGEISISREITQIKHFRVEPKIPAR